MTGAYVRVKRGTGWQNIEVEHLTPSERRDMFRSREFEEVMRWMDCICQTVVEQEKFLDGLVADGILDRKED